ncbi:Alpha/Beta hydrolase protein [Fusarium redolens]|uniref:Alpha/Beta hydrolase protein n=1 Tax=Fusarium redolens TaxID=48865 RepID=A0A9P9H9F8_FUSRE|nr:Alpha/Beta hydrolase protein [Fusarium redolens]KAH7253594.1 Alpha/Beta hydrolase protein [Fusarium redolens]
MSEKASASASQGESFGPIYTIEPVEPHTHTAILLHGRGSNSEEFARELFEETLLSDQANLAQKLSSWRWVFPSSRELWSTAFQEDMPAWFEAHSLTDTTARQDLQIPGIKESVNYIKAILDQEIERLGGDTTKVVLGGISQGAAVGMWTLLCLDSIERPLGAFLATNTWLPFASSIRDYLSNDRPATTDEGLGFAAEMLAPSKVSSTQSRERLLSTAVFLGHGTDDAYVDVELGREARNILIRVGFEVEWREYQGAELEGHWFKAPEEVDDILNFLVTHVEKS